MVKDDNSEILFRYDAAGNRIAKITDEGTSVYARDASGNVMAVYKDDELEEQSIYGSSRLGLVRQASRTAYRSLGGKKYELSNHLGNVLAVVSDNIRMDEEDTWADVVNTTDYYPFGLAMDGRTQEDGEYRYGFQGHEKDDEVKGAGNHYSFGDYGYDPIVGRRWNVDPMADAPKLIGYSPYSAFANNPITYVDPDGRCFQKVGEEYVPCDDKADVGSTTTGAFGHSWTMTESSGWQLTNGADPSTVNFEYDFIEASGNADYYTNRYKNHIEKYNTRPPDYYLGYGHKYINRFKNDTRAKLSDLGKEWLDETAVALQVLMNDGISSNPSLQGDNSAFHSFAYGTHVPAYSGSGKIGKLKVPDLWHVSMTPDFSDSFFSPEGRSQIIQMFPHILKGPRYPDGFWDPKRNPGNILVNPGPKW